MTKRNISVYAFRNKYPGFARGSVTTPKKEKEEVSHEIRSRFILYRGYSVINLWHDWMEYCRDVVREHETHGTPIPDVNLYGYAKIILVAAIGKGRFTPAQVKKGLEYKRAMRTVYYYFRRQHYLEQGKEYYEQYKVRKQKKAHEYYLRHRRLILTRSKRNYRKHRASRLEKNREYYRKHPGEKHDWYIRRRDALRLARLVNFTFGEL